MVDKAYLNGGAKTFGKSDSHRTGNIIRVDMKNHAVVLDHYIDHRLDP